MALLLPHRSPSGNRGAIGKLNIALIGGGGIAKTAYGECRAENVVAIADIGCHTLDIPKYAMGLGYPTLVEMEPELDFRKEFDGNSPKGDAATYRYEFPARGDQPPVTVYWYEGGRMPKLPKAVLEADKNGKLSGGGCLMVGDKNMIFSPGMRPTSPRLVGNWMELRRELPAKTLTRAVGNPVKEIKAAIRGEIAKCGSNFAYAVPLTETVILGTIAIRSGKKVEYDPATMTIKDASLNAFIKEPVRKGWEFGEGLIKA